MISLNFDSRLFRILITGVALSVTGFAAQAQEQIGVLGNTVTVSNAGGGFGPTAIPISAGGVVNTISNVPTSGTLDVPTFSFNIVPNGVTDGAYTFRAGFIIDEAGSSRRLELQLPTVNMTFSGGGTTLVGTVPNAQSVRVLGRDASGTVTAAANVNSAGIVNFTNTTLAFDADDQLALIASGGGVLADIINTIDTLGKTYNYTIVLNQTAGPATLIFGANPGGGFTAYPTSAADFVLNTNELQANFTGGHKVTGQLSFGTGGGGGGGGGGGEQSVDAQISNSSAATSALASQIAAGGVNQVVLDGFATLISNTTATASLVSAGLQAGTVTVSSGIQLLNALTSQVGVAQQLTTADAQVEAAAINSIVSNMASVIGGMRGKTLAPSELIQLRSAVNELFTDTASLLASLRGKFGFISSSALVSSDAITLDTSIADIGGIVDSLEASINAAIAVTGFDFNASVFNSIQNTSQTSLELLLAPLAAQLGLTVTYLSDVDTQTLLSNNTALLGRVLASTAVNVGTSTEVPFTALKTALETSGLSIAFAESLTTELTGFIKADSLTLDSGSGPATASSSLASAIGATALVVNGANGIVNYTTPSGPYDIYLAAVSPAPAGYPTGSFALPDGSRVVIQNNLAFTFVSALHDPVAFAGAIQKAGNGTFSTSVTANGSVKLREISSNAVFSSSVSTNANTVASTVSEVTFTAPAGDPAAASYLFTVTYTDGTNQVISPAISDPAFFQSVTNYGFAVTTDRATGMINIGGFMFRPDYFVTPLSASDTIFLNGNADSSGVAYRPLDANGDGKTDYQVLTANGLQVVYGL